MPIWESGTLVPVGEILKPYGYLGMVKVAFFMPQTELKPLVVAGKSFIYIDVAPTPVPFPIQAWHRDVDKEGRLHLEGIDTEQLALDILQCKLYLPTQCVTNAAALNPKWEIAELLGYILRDKATGVSLGTVTEVYDQTLQPLIEVLHHGATYLVPFHADLIPEIDEATQTLWATLPDGLVDLDQAEAVEDDESGEQEDAHMDGEEIV